MDLSIVVTSYNTNELLNRCLESIYRSLKDSNLTFEVIVVDNASNDGTQELLNKKYERVIKIFNKENIGYGNGNNLGIQKAKGEYILLINSDIKVLGDAISKLHAFASQNPDSFVGGKLLNEDGSDQPSCGPTYILPIVFCMLFLKGDFLKITRYSPNIEKTVDWVSGACLMARKDAFLKVELFDDKIFMYMEEIDLLYRAKRTGYTVLFYPEARFVHTGAASSGNKKRPVVNIYQGLQFFYQKHMAKEDQLVLRFMLILKARIAIFFAKLTGWRDTAEIYEEALRILK